MNESSVALAYRAPDSPDPISSIGAAIARRAHHGGDAPALIGPGSRNVSFSQLAASISSFGRQLAKAGLRREDRVGLLVPPGAAGGQLVMALACNITLVPVNPGLTPHELIEVAKLSRLRAVVIPRWLQAPARSAMREQGAIALEALLADDGTLSLELLTPAPEATTLLRAARASDTAVLLRSSGTTGAPKLIAVTHGNLLAMAGKLGSDRWFRLTAQDRAACMLPLYYAAGLKTSLFVPLILGASVGFPPVGRATDIAQWIDDLKPTYLAVAPGPLNGIVDRLKSSTHQFEGDSLRFVMCGSAYLAEDVRQQAQWLLRVPVLEFYGLSEAGVMAANPVPPGKVRPGTVGLIAPGEVLIVDSNRTPLPTGEVGQIMISGPTVTPDHALTGDARLEALKDGWLLTGDLGRVDAQGYLTIVGRVKEVINRGGEKVFPYEIEKALLAHPAVQEAAAFGVPHPRLGESVAAAVVLKPGSAVGEQDLKAFLAGRLAGFKLPRRLYLVAGLPRGNTGKVLRRSLAQACAAQRDDIAEPDALLEFELRDIWVRLLGTGDIGIDDDFFDKGGDSLLATQMLVEVERLLGRPYPSLELATLTIRRMADVITSGQAVERSLMTQVKQGPGIPLFFCHGDHATRGMYAHKLAALLPGDQPVYLLNCYADAGAGSSVEEMAHAYLQEVLRVAPSSPVVIGGYCSGGLAAWHLAHLLRARDVPVAELLLVETTSLNARPSFRWLHLGIAGLASRVPGKAGRFLREGGMRAAWILRREGLARLATLLAGAARKKLVPALRRLPPASGQHTPDTAAKTYYQLMSRYLPPRIDAEVTCFIAREGVHSDTDPRYWRALAPYVREVMTSGTHQTVFVGERGALAKALADTMERAAARFHKIKELGPK